MTVYVEAVRGKENLEALSKSIISFERPDMESAPEFRSYDVALDELTILSKEKGLSLLLRESISYKSKACHFCNVVAHY